MNSEFQQLAEKVSQLARLAHSLRDDNADLRRKLQVQTDESTAKLRALSEESANKLQALSTESSARIEALTMENLGLKQRVDDAYERVSAVLAQLPMAQPDVPTDTTEEAA